MSTPRTHLVIPDTQVKPGVPLNHFLWAAHHAIRRRPDVIVHVGDHWDMPSLSQWDKGKMEAEGRAYVDDINAGNYAIDLFMRPIRRVQMRQLRYLMGKRWRRCTREEKRYIERCAQAQRVLLPCPKSLQPWLWALRLVFCIGNHEQRIMRHVSAHPELRRHLSYENFNLKRWGWEVHDFLHPVVIDDISYQHYVPNPNTGRPWGGMAEPRLAKIGYTFISGHEQGKKTGERYLQNGHTQRAGIFGSYYLHDEDYKGPQGNYHWRGLVTLHDVGAGDFDIMETRMQFLERNYYKHNPDASRQTIRYVAP